MYALGPGIEQIQDCMCEIRGGLLAQIFLNEGLRFLKAAAV